MRMARLKCEESKLIVSPIRVQITVFKDNSIVKVNLWGRQGSYWTLAMPLDEALEELNAALGDWSEPVSYDPDEE